jgi:ankyrin repeat protein
VLLCAGATPNAGAEEGVPTPLHLAAGDGHLETVRVLLDAGADPAARDRQFNSTPVGWAEYAGHSDVVRLLSAPPAR